MSKAILTVKDLSVSYGSIHAVKNISFEVQEGEIVTLIGANGAGKSTTLNAIARLLPASGEIRFAGDSLMHVPGHSVLEKGLAMVPEGRRIFLRMTVEENLEMGAYIKSRTEAREEMEDVYERFPRLKERREQIAGTLSGGEQQMLAMGRALMSKPRLLMMDEPSMGLAPILVEQIFGIIRELNAAGTTILLVEQKAHHGAVVVGAEELVGNEIYVIDVRVVCHCVTQLAGVNAPHGEHEGGRLGYPVIVSVGHGSACPEGHVAVAGAVNHHLGKYCFASFFGLDNDAFHLA